MFALDKKFLLEFNVDMLPQDFSPPPGSPVSLFTLGSLSPRQVQPIADETSEVRRPSSPSVDSPVESTLTGSSLPPPVAVQDTRSSPVCHRVVGRALSRCRRIRSSWTGPFIVLPLVCAAPTLHPRIGGDKGGCAYQFTTYRDYDFAVRDRRLGASGCTKHVLGEFS